MVLSSINTPKMSYRVKNWREYNESLVRRGDFTFWFDESVVDAWEHDNAGRKVGRPFVYSDIAIEALLTLRELFRLPYRQTEGLGRALTKLMQADIAIPNFTLLQKRACKMNIAIAVDSAAAGPIDVVVDSTGVKVHGEGEWKVRSYGVERRRTWRKLHLAVDPLTHEIVAQVLTTNGHGDANQVAPLLEQIARPVEKFYADGGYDYWHVYDLFLQENIKPIISLRKNASIRQHGNSASAPLPRDEHLRQIRRDGRTAWKKAVGYHRRSLAETAMFRIKRCFGGNLKNRQLKNQTTEAALRCKLLNHFTSLGMPDSIWSG
jgi:hypothetical protein